MSDVYVCVSLFARRPQGSMKRSINRPCSMCTKGRELLHHPHYILPPEEAPARLCAALPLQASCALPAPSALPDPAYGQAHNCGTRKSLT